MPKLYYQGHGSFRIVSDRGSVIYVDPYIDDGCELPADLVLITHEHHDHNKTELLTMKESTLVLRAADMLLDGVYKTADYEDIHIQAVQAYNKNHDRNACVGYIVTVDGKKIYCAGDTSTTEQMAEMAAMKLDYALLPMDGKYNMDPAEASACAKLIAAKHSIPIHMAPGQLFDQSIAETFEAEGRIIVPAGEDISL